MAWNAQQPRTTPKHGLVLATSPTALCRSHSNHAALYLNDTLCVEMIYPYDLVGCLQPSAENWSFLDRALASLIMSFNCCLCLHPLNSMHLMALFCSGTQEMLPLKRTQAATTRILSSLLSPSLSVLYVCPSPVAAICASTAQALEMNTCAFGPQLLVSPPLASSLRPTSSESTNSPTS